MHLCGHLTHVSNFGPMLDTLYSYYYHIAIVLLFFSLYKQIAHFAESVANAPPSAQISTTWPCCQIGNILKCVNSAKVLPTFATMPRCRAPRHTHFGNCCQSPRCTTPRHTSALPPAPKFLRIFFAPPPSARPLGHCTCPLITALADIRSAVAGFRSACPNIVQFC